MDATASSLITILQKGGDHRDLYYCFYSYLRPLSDLVPPNSRCPRLTQKPPRIRTRKNALSSASIHSLADKFLSFIDEALQLLPTLFQAAASGKDHRFEERENELLAVYALLLHCLGCLLPALEQQPFTLHMLRARFLRCLVSTGNYEKAQNEADFLLNELISALAPPGKVYRSKKLKGTGHAQPQILLPHPKVVATDEPLITALVIDIIISLCNCASNSRSQNPEAYLKILSLLAQIQPWLGLLDNEAAKKKRLQLLRPLYTCTAFLTSQCRLFSRDLVSNFCSTMLRECAICSFSSLMISATKICFLVDLNWVDGSSIFFDVIRATLNLSLGQCKDQLMKDAKEFLDFVSSTCHIVNNAQPNICKVASDNLNDRVQKLVKHCRPAGLILSLYSSALYFKSNITFNQTVHMAAPYATILGSQKLEHLIATIEVLSGYFSEKGEDGNASGLFLAYIDVLEFWCQVLLPCVEAGWRNYCSEGKDFLKSPNWSNIFEVLQTFCCFGINAFKAKIMSGKVDKERTDETRQMLLKSLLSGLRICFFAAAPYEKCCDFARIVLSREWASPTELAFFVSSLSSMMVQVSYNIQSHKRHVLKAPVAAALKLYHEGVLAKFRLICHNHSIKSEDISNERLKSIQETVLDGYEKIQAIIPLLHNLHPGDISSISDITVCTLSEMSLVDDVHKIQSNSFTLVKAWAEVLCKEYNDADKKYDAPTLYHLLTKNKDKNSWSRMSLGRIIEKELLAYQQLESDYPNVCKIMQEKVFKVLLEDLYSENDSFKERSRILVAKARALRASGVNSLRGSLACLSEAISVLRDAISDYSEGQASTYHQLATTYILHAQCAQENKLDFEVISGDVNSALDLLLKIDIEHYICSNGVFELVPKDMVLSLCSLIDLLSIKGCYTYHSRICMLVSKAFKRECVPTQKLLCFLVSHRRLGHTNCGVQMDLELISSTLQNCDARAHLTEFWASSLKGNNAFLSMFTQSLLLNCPAFPKMNEKGFEKFLQCKIGIDEIKQITSSLISDPKVPSHSTFIAGYLYYDLSQRLLSEGKLFEALYYAEEAFNLRKKLLHRRFMYVEKNPSDVHIETLDSVATSMWPQFTRAGSITDSYLSPWIVLKSYLESTFQVGSINESIGNGAEAECKFRTGKEISRRQLLHSFEIIFTSSLCQLYCKRQLWDMAESELSSAQKLLLESKPALSCDNCKMFLETTVNIQLGDLLYSRYKHSSQNRSLHTLEDASHVYQSALNKLAHHELLVPMMKEAETDVALNGTCKSCMLLKQPAYSDCNKKASENRGILKELNLDAKKPVQTARARFCKTSTVAETKEEPATEINNSKNMRKKPNLKCKKDSASYTAVCWACLVTRVLDSGSLTKLVHFGVEFRRCSLLLSLQLKIARAFGARGTKSNVHEIHILYLKCIFLLFSGSHGANSSEIHVHQFMELIADEQCKALSVDRALILYSMSFFLLKNGVADQYGNPCCTIASFQMRDVVTWLLRAFVFSREFPLLLQKISRLLASTLILSSVDCSIHVPLHLDKSLSLNHWASYFHQASISTSLNTLHQRAMNKISPKVNGGMDEAYSNKFVRFSFENTCQLEEHVGSFFKDLPDVPIICISMFDRDYAALLEETLITPSFHAWIMLSRVDSTSQPITILLPADEIREEHHDLETFKLRGSIELTKEWESHWGHTVLDNVAPSFKLLLQEDLLCHKVPSDRENYWKWRMKINDCLGLLLGSIDKSWFGPWNCLLMGHRMNIQNEELFVPTLINHLEPLINSVVNPSLVKAILHGSNSLVNAQKCISQLISYGGSLGHGGFCKIDRFRGFSASRNLGCEIPESVIKVLEDAFCGPLSEHREPVIFVLDTKVQMLPWESLPSFRKQEVYRMPSIGSIFLTLDRNYNRHIEKAREEVLFGNSYFPEVDPFDTYYLLNPDGNLKITEDDLKPWLAGLNFKGRTGVPTREELGFVLRNHDMFFYLGHGGGTKYISRDKIERLEIRAAALLMGCSSGKLLCQGNYAPKGVPLSYLFAGSPAVVANLWDVTDREIDKFTKAIVNSWVQEAEPVSCLACGLDEEPTRGGGKQRHVSGFGKRCCEGCATRRMASSISKARDACKLHMLTGAAPVCYGVPTVLRRKGSMR